MYPGKSFTRLLLITLVCILPKLAFCQDTAASFSLTAAAATSAGVYKTDGTLIRTLWSGLSYPAGTHKINWDGTDDEGSVMPKGIYNVKILSNNVKYQWEGVIGNTSDSMTGSSKYRAFDIINCMTITGNTAYCGTGYNEGNTSELKFNLSKPQQKTAVLSLQHSTSQASYYTATDGTNVYWAGNDPFSANAAAYFVFATKTTDDLETVFAEGKPLQMVYGRKYLSVIDYVNNSSAKISGIAVQKNHDYLLVAHRDVNEVHVVSKSTGKLVQTIGSFTRPRGLWIDGNDDLWIISGTNKLEKYMVASDGSLSGPLVSIINLTEPLAVTTTPDNTGTVVLDGGNSQQIKAFSNSNGTASWIFGRAGGYSSDPTVADDKFYFSDAKGDVQNTFICYAPDGSFWVSDPGNYRVQHFSAARNYIDHIMYLPHNYSMFVDGNNPGRVFSEYLEFAIDYSRPLAANNGSWALVKNRRGSIPAQYYNGFISNVFSSVMTLSNGRTYGFLFNYTTNKTSVVELLASGPIRFTGIEIVNASKSKIYPDGSLRTVAGNDQFGGPLSWSKQPLTGFDAANNPVWGSPVSIASNTATADTDPVLGGAHMLPAEITSSDIIISFSGNAPSYGSKGYHLGGMKVGDNKWLWKTSPSTFKEYAGLFPDNGAFDIGNQAQYTGNVAMAIDRSVVWGYNGEFWKGGQTNKWNHYYDNGLFIGQFGTTGSEVNNMDAPAQMAGNAFSPAIVKVGGDYYMYHNDESFHGGVHRWKITGLNTITEQTVTITDSFHRNSEEPLLPGNDLMKGLPFNSVLQTGTAGWTRNPAAEDNSAFNQQWSVKTNVKTFSKKKSPDVFARYISSSPYSVERDLGKNVNLSSWKLYGKVSFEGDVPNTDNIQLFQDVLDNTGKILVRFYITIDYAINVYANNVLIASGKNPQMDPVINSFQPLAISMTGKTLSVAYSSFPAVTVSPFNASADIMAPQVMRLFFDGKGGDAYNKVVILDEWRFVPGQSSSYYRSKTTGPWFSASTWESSADSISWAAATTVPSLQAAAISILNGHTVTISDTATINHVFVKNGGTLNIGPRASITIADAPGTDDISIAPGGNFVIKSDISGTGRIANSAGTVSGHATVERFINATGNAAYRLLAPSVNTAGGPRPSIRDNWQEGQNNLTPLTNSNSAPGYGTHITGSVSGINGFDATLTGLLSLQLFDQSGPLQTLLQAANTSNTDLNAKKGYFLFVKGDRSMDPNNAGATSATILRATGKLLTGDQVFTGLESNGRTNLITNPYASPVDWNVMYKDPSAGNAGNFENYYTYLDPAIGKDGGFVTVKENGIKSAATSTFSKIESGFAFFVKTRTGISNPSFTIKESHKSTPDKVYQAAPETQEQFMVSLFYNDNSRRIMADAVNVVFDNAYSATLDNDDAEEMPNWQENIAISRKGKMLSIESRPQIALNDTIPLSISGMKSTSYEWQIDPKNFPGQLYQAFLEDRFLNKYYLINIYTSTVIPFSITANPASAAQDRFRILFELNALLPVSFIALSASERPDGIMVKWTAVNQQNVVQYEVEKSTDGLHFEKMASLPGFTNLTSGQYNWLDKTPATGDNYFRIKATDSYGKINYSAVAIVKTGSGAATCKVYPNPLKGNQLQLYLDKMPRGNYALNLSNTGGQVVYSGSVNYVGGSSIHTIFVPGLPAGIYNLQITGMGFSMTKKIIN